MDEMEAMAASTSVTWTHRDTHRESVSRQARGCMHAIFGFTSAHPKLAIFV